MIWNSGASTTANLQLLNQNTALSGNDFAIDDVNFQKQCSDVDTVKVFYHPDALKTVNATICNGSTYQVGNEIFEESGIRCTDVKYYMTQPWPYPSSLMIGCTARATSEDIIVDRAELEDARWFDRDEATLMIKREHPDGLAGPHPFAIAHHLLGRWLHEGTNAGA